MKFTLFTLTIVVLVWMTNAQSPYRYANSRASTGYSSTSYDDNNNSNSYSSAGSTNYRPSSSVSSGTTSNSYGSTGRQYRRPESNSPKSGDEPTEADEEENQKPTRLQILLESSKFSCSGKKDGYYADNSVNCEVFHYCVASAKHSWACPEGTVFHQVHLNCVPSSQDICGDTDKYSAQVNDYLHKPLEQRGPNNTVLYHQRYYPEEFVGVALLNNLPGVQTFGYQPTTQPQTAPQRPPTRNTYTYDNADDDDDQPAGYSQPSRPSRPHNAYSYQGYNKPKPASIPSYNKPANKPIPIAPAPQPYVSNYRPVTSTVPRRSEYNGYQPTSKPVTSYNSYSSSPYRSSAASASSLSSNSPSAPSSGTRTPFNLPPYKLSPNSFNANARTQTYKPATSPFSGGATYATGYDPTDSSSSSIASSTFNYGNQRQPVRSRYEAGGATFPEEEF